MNKSMANNARLSIPLPKKIWCKIRYYQQLYDISKETLAEQLNVQPRTLSNYDSKPENLTIGQICQFLKYNNLIFSDLIG